MHRSLLQEIARRFKDSPTVTGYELFNEPSSSCRSGEYPGRYEMLHNDRIEEGCFWNYERQVEHILETEGWQFSEKYLVPLWISEFGSQYCTGDQDNSFRLASMDDQLRAMNELKLHWTPWTYKDCGTMGLMTVSPESEYMQRIAPVQRMKGLLAAENFTAWRSDCPGKKVTREFTKYMMSLLTLSNQYTFGTFQKCMNYALLTNFAAGVLQPEYAALFEHDSADDICRIMDSFLLKNCIVNEAYLKILRNRLDDPMIPR